MTNELVSLLFQSRLQAHIWHLKTDSYAQHVALQGYYQGIVPLVDRLAECCIAHHGNMDYYKKYGTTNDGDYAEYFESLKNAVSSLRQDDIFDYPDCQAIIDEIEELISSTVYKLRYLS